MAIRMRMIAATTVLSMLGLSAVFLAGTAMGTEAPCAPVLHSEESSAAPLVSHGHDAPREHAAHTAGERVG